MGCPGSASRTAGPAGSVRGARRRQTPVGDCCQAKSGRLPQTLERQRAGQQAGPGAKPAFHWRAPARAEGYSEILRRSSHRLRTAPTRVAMHLASGEQTPGHGPAASRRCPRDSLPANRAGAHEYHCANKRAQWEPCPRTHQTFARTSPLYGQGTSHPLALLRAGAESSARGPAQKASPSAALTSLRPSSPS